MAKRAMTVHSRPADERGVVTPRPDSRVTRARAILCSLVVLLGVAVAACAPVDVVPPPPECPTIPPDDFTSVVMNRVNDERRAAGLPVVWWSPRLACLANDTAHRIAEAGRLGHTDLVATIHTPDFSGYAYLAENILVGGPELSPFGAHDIWMASPHHRENVLGDFDTIGIAWVRGPDGRIWVAEEFGRHQ